MREFYELINQCPWTTVLLALFIALTLSDIPNALVKIFKK